MTDLSELTNECLSQISSLTSPKDVLGLTSALEQLVTVSESNAVWEKFLPPDCNDIVFRSSFRIPRDLLAYKKELFLYLSRVPIILLDKRTTSFALDKTSGKVFYMLGSRALSITWGHRTQYWSWESIPGSRFPACAVLKNIHWLNIQGKVRTTLLSQGTSYGAYFVFKINNVGSSSTGFRLVPVKVSVSVFRKDGLPINDHVETKSVYLEAPRSDEEGRERPPGGLPTVRDDGWMEIEMGRYQVGNGERVELIMRLEEFDTLNLKKGLVVHGIEIRPTS